MYTSSLIALLPLLPAALAKTTKITVGDGGLIFKPDNVNAAVGDLLEFHFYPEDHSVAQSSFDKPCEANQTGIWSDFVLVKKGAKGGVFTVMVNNTDPLWLYCSKEDHCVEGMAMVVNAP